LHTFGPAGLHVLQLLAMSLFVAAGVGFARRALRTGDELLAWFATGSVLAAFAHLNYFLFPSLYSDWIYAGDVLRLSFYAVVLLATAQEIRRYWQRMAEAEVAEERRRLARELHDGVAQELAFIARRARTATAGLDTATVAQISVAAERARSEARRAVAALAAQGDEPFAQALIQAVEHITAQGDVRLRTDVDGEGKVARDVGEHLIRIACEAVSNAVRHSNAEEVLVELSARDSVRLRVADDGAGFDPDAVPARPQDAFGMIIMRERAQRIVRGRWDGRTRSGQ
jgi:signal transduction histidine kinase